MWPKGELKFSDGAWIWDGGPVAKLRENDLWADNTVLYSHQVQSGETLQCGDYRVRILKERWHESILFVVRDAWYFPLFVFADKAERTAQLVKIFIIRLGVIWGLGIYPGEGAMYGWYCLRPVRWMQQSYMSTQRLYRRYLSGYAIRKRLFWIEAQLRDLSARPFGYRFLSVAKGDYDVMVYLNGSDESEQWASETLVPRNAGVWGKGWVYRHKLNKNGKPYQENGIVAAECIYGQVMWRPIRAEVVDGWNS